MIKKLITAGLLVSSLMLVGCAKPDMKAPCPNYGTKCPQTPINSWNY